MAAPRRNSRAIVVLGATGVALAGCEVERAAPSPSLGFPAFAEVSREAGIDFAHQRGATPTRYLIETARVPGPGLEWVWWARVGE